VAFSIPAFDRITDATNGFRVFRSERLRDGQFINLNGRRELVLGRSSTTLHVSSGPLRLTSFPAH
jgi:hypothetical protein